MAADHALAAEVPLPQVRIHEPTSGTPQVFWAVSFAIMLSA
jgi:hypothetical protein